MSAPKLTFRPIEVQHDADICIAHRTDSFIVSFGDASRFHEGKGTDGYLEWLAEHTQDEGTCVMALDGDEIVGQLECMYAPEHEAAHVYLYYIVPSRRRQGLGSQLDDYVTALFSKRRCQMLSLFVSRTNENAIRFYEARGWKDIPGGRHSSEEQMRMERRLPDSDAPNP